MRRASAAVSAAPHCASAAGAVSRLPWPACGLALGTDHLQPQRQRAAPPDGPRPLVRARTRAPEIAHPIIACNSYILLQHDNAQALFNIFSAKG